MMRHAIQSMIFVLCLMSAIRAQQRVWRDASGTFTVTGEMLDVADDRVRLRKEDGSEIEVPLARLSAEDQAFVKEHGAADAPPPAKPGNAGAGTATRRVWKDESGDFSVEAELVEQSETHVRLRKQDGSVIAVPLVRLSQADRIYLRRARKFSEVTPIDRELILQEQVSVHFDQTSLIDAVSQLAEQHRVSMHIDLWNLKRLGIEPSHPVSFQAANETLEFVLRELLLSVNDGLAFGLYRNEVVFITRGGLVSDCPRVYRLRRLPERYLETQSERDRFNYVSLLNRIHADIAPETWNHQGGFATLKMIHLPVSGSATRQNLGRRDAVQDMASGLVIGQTFSNHREIERLFADDLERVDLRGKKYSASLPLPERLMAPASFTVRDMPLEDFALYIRNTLSVPVDIDIESMAKASIDTKIPVTGSFREVRLFTALDLLLHDIQCAWSVNANSPPEGPVTIYPRAGAPLIEKDYPVSEFAKYLVGFSQQGRPQFRYDLDSITEVIVQTVRPGSWQVVGGLATITSDGRDTLTIRQTLQGHIAICDLLDHFETMQQP